MLMRHFRTFFICLNIALALSMAVQLFLPAIGYSNVVKAAPASPPAPARPQTASSTPPGISANLQTALDLMVRQSLSAAGWTIVSLSSQLDPGAVQGTALSPKASGKWHVQVLDEQRQPLTLEGVLTFRIQAESQENALPGADLRLKGTLDGSQVQLAVDLDISGAIRANSQSQAVSMILQLTRNGRVSNITVQSSSESRPLAHNVTQVIASSSIDRDGKKAESTQTLTTREFGNGEREGWLQSSMNTNANQSEATTINQHFFGRTAGTGVAEYLDRFDLKTANDSYALRVPATISGTLNGDVSYDLTLVDPLGKTIQLTSAAKGSSLNIPIPSKSGSEGDAKLGPDAGRLLAGLSSRLPLGEQVSYVMTRGAANPIASHSGAGIPVLDGCDASCVLFWTAVAAVAIGFVIVASAGAGLALVMAFEAEAGVGTALGATIAAGDAAGAAALFAEATSTLGGVAAAGAILGSLGALLGLLEKNNADPYFVRPDIRPVLDAINPAPVQITRITSGLITPSTLLNAMSPITSTASAPYAGQPFTYRDRAEGTIGGALPSGSTAVGNWTWDNTHTFRGAPSHTEPAVNGAQHHYFIHAANPLTARDTDNLIQYVYLDPQNPPSEIYLQFYTSDGDGEHRAYWGDDRVQTGGKSGTPALYPMGALPEKGGWVRLQIPANALGLGGKPINGVLYGAFGGETWWGATTTSSRTTDNAPDKLAIADSPAGPPSQPGAQIAYRLTLPMALTVEIVDANDKPIRTLLGGAARPAGYQVTSWDGKDNRGATVPDVPYRLRFSADGKIIAEDSVFTTPIVATITSPGPNSLVRGLDVPVFGDAYSANFDHYVVEYGEGLNPQDWTQLVQSQTATTLPTGGTLSHIDAGNLANWNVGLDEYKPLDQPGLNGIYTLRLRVVGKDGREVSDTLPVIVGRLAHFAEGGTIVSPDGKARLTIPPLATRNAFALMALIPLTSSEPDGAWRQNLPANTKLAGPVYEILPANETWRQPATLELPYDAGSPADKLGVMLGDGTSAGWHYVSAKVDAAKQIVSIQTSGFGGTRVLAAPFVISTPAPSLDSENVSRALAFDSGSAAPFVTSGTAPFAFYTDLESNAGEWAALDIAGTQLERVAGQAAGLTADNVAIKVTRLAGGVRIVRVRSTPYDAVKYPLLNFDYRFPSDYVPDLLVKSNGIWWQLNHEATGTEDTNYFHSLHIAPLQADDSWHHAQIDVLAMLREAQPDETRFQIDEIVLGQFTKIAYMQTIPTDSGVVGDAYYMGNFAALAPTLSPSLVFAWSPPLGSTMSAYSYLLDQKNDTVPPATSQSRSAGATLALPAGALDGVWYLHVRGLAANGQWSSTAHFQLLIDRQPPQIGVPDPAPNGAGSPGFIQIPIIDDSSGLDLSTLRLELNGQSYGTGRALTYSALDHTLQFIAGLLQPAPAASTDGAQLNLSLQVSDYAGNSLTAPYAWSFTADVPTESGDAFRALTAQGGGTSPALSPDGLHVAFVSHRSGSDKIWAMQTDDVQEKNASAAALTTATATEADPAWSPDGAQLAFASNANGSLQIWSAAADGSKALAITAGTGGASSPTWSPDSKTIIFIRDGNLWQVNSDGTGGLRVLTQYPEHPLKAVRWQPGGQLLAVDFKLYQETIDLYDLASGELHSLTVGGTESDPAWLNAGTVLYTAPAGRGLPNAVWQVQADGTGAAILAGSGLPGIDDAQPASAANGNAVALVSTRGGTPNIWVQTAYQITRFDVSPSNGVAPGEPVRINYDLPADAQVTLQVLNGGENIQLLDKTPQSMGANSVTWNANGANNSPLAAGEYVVKLSAQLAAGGNPIERIASVRVLDPVTLGTLQVQVNQWADQPLQDPIQLSIQVYPQGERLRSSAQAVGDAGPSLVLPAGRYDLVITLGDLRREVTGIAIEPGKTTTNAVNLALGELDIALATAPGQPVSGDAYTQVTRSDDPNNLRLAASYSPLANFVLPPGTYDVQSEFEGVQQSVESLQVKEGQVTRHELNLGSGVLRLNVLSFAGQPAATNAQLVVDAYSPKDHTQSLAHDFANPANLRLPAGRYDIRVQYGVVPLNPNTGGVIVRWINGIEIQAGQTLTQELDLHLGEVKVEVLEAAGKVADANNLIFNIYPQGDRTNNTATALYTNHETFQLPPGEYEVVASYYGNEYESSGSIRSTLHVIEGQSTASSVNLQLGRIRVEVRDALGQLVPADELSVNAYPAGQRGTSSAIVYNQNPVELFLRSKTVYDLVVDLNGKQLVLAGQSVNEGESVSVKLNASDFK
jgi:flagellar hook assembly protein FlgD